MFDDRFVVITDFEEEVQAGTGEVEEVAGELAAKLLGILGVVEDFEQFDDDLLRRRGHRFRWGSPILHAAEIVRCFERPT